jgi:hypothetical protein
MRANNTRTKKTKLNQLPMLENLAIIPLDDDLLNI